jgi:hypothetical protein
MLVVPVLHMVGRGEGQRLSERLILRQMLRLIRVLLLRILMLLLLLVLVLLVLVLVLVLVLLVLLVLPFCCCEEGGLPWTVPIVKVSHNWIMVGGHRYIRGAVGSALALRVLRASGRRGMRWRSRGRVWGWGWGWGWV